MSSSRRFFLAAAIVVSMLAPVSRATITVTKLGAAAGTSVAASNCAVGGVNPNGCFSVTITATSASASLYAFINWANATETLSEGTYLGTTRMTACTGFRSTDTNGGGTDCAYLLSSVSGQTTVFVGTSTTVQPSSITVYQAAFTNGPMALDAVSTPVDQCTSTHCTTIPTPALTITGSSEVVFESVACGSSCTSSPGISNSYTGDYTGSDGTAFKVTTSTTAPTWSQTSASSAATSAVTFKETGGGGSPPNCTIATLGAGAC